MFTLNDTLRAETKSLSASQSVCGRQQAIQRPVILCAKFYKPKVDNCNRHIKLDVTRDHDRLNAFAEKQFEEDVRQFSHCNQTV